MELLEQIQCGLDAMTPERRAWLHRAYALLPAQKRPRRILDVGCGRGGPTLELARLGNELVGIDTDKWALEELRTAAEAAGLADRVSVRQASMLAIDFAAASFDIVWSEGSIHVIGFEEGLARWRPLLIPGGCLVVHESAWLRADPPPAAQAYWTPRFPCIRTLESYAAAAGRLGYEWIGGFTFPETFWWEGYYRPLRERVRALRREHAGDRRAEEIFERKEAEIARYRREMRWFGSAYLLMRDASGSRPVKGGAA
ncbi:MAG: methyltransferase domain-containing protein [Candidatus Eisenbacteria bacterium]|nr:methyltransferase domain-containing protein [Candidatus Eisenbacteria bacterium]